MGKTFTMFRERLLTKIRSLERTRIRNSIVQERLEHISIMLKDGKDKVSYLANLESVSKTRQLLYSPVKNLKKRLTTLEVLNVEGRPNEGDLIWFPVTKHLFEIKFVEAEKSMLSKLHFEYSDEDIDTGSRVNFANAITVSGSGDFTVGEIVAWHNLT